MIDNVVNDLNDCMPLAAADCMNNSSTPSEIQSLTLKALEKLLQIPNHWDDHYNICIELYQLRVDVELCLGN